MNFHKCVSSIDRTSRNLYTEHLGHLQSGAIHENEFKSLEMKILFKTLSHPNRSNSIKFRILTQNNESIDFN